MGNGFETLWFYFLCVLYFSEFLGWTGVAFIITKINFIKIKVNLEVEGLGEQSLSSGLCLDYGCGRPKLEGNAVDKGQAELGIDTNSLLGFEDGSTPWKWCLGWSEVLGEWGG